MKIVIYDHFFLPFKERLAAYREFVYEIGALVTDKGKKVDQSVLDKHRRKGFNVSSLDRLRYRIRYFIDSGVIGSRSYVQKIYSQFSDIFKHKRERKPVPIRGLDALYSLKPLVLDAN